MKTQKTHLVILDLLLLVLSISGCTLTSPNLQNNNDFRYFKPTVSYKGETLSLIADWYLGSPEKLSELVDMNCLVADRGLQIGDSVRIPSEYAITRNPPSLETVNKHLQKIKSKKKISAIVTLDDEKIAKLEPPVQDLKTIDITNVEVNEQNQPISQELKEQIIAPLLESVPTNTDETH